MKTEINRVIYARLLRPYLRPGARVLEIGCCDAKNFTYLSTYAAGLRYVGLDLDYENLRKARDCGVAVLAADLEHAGLPLKATFDIIVITEVLEHVRDPGNLLKRLAPLMKPDGVILISLPHEYNLISCFRCLFRRGIDDNALTAKDKHLHFPTIAQSVAFIEQHLTIVRMEFWSSGGGVLNRFLRYFPDSWFMALARISPSLFSRGIIFLCRQR